MTRRTVSWAGVVTALVMVGAVLVGPALAPRPVAVPVGPPWDPAAGTLGTDQLGRDVWSRLLAGGRGLLVCLPIGVATTALGAALGLLGVVVEPWGRFLRGVTSALLAVPGVLVVLAAATTLPSWAAVSVVMLVLGVPLTARSVQASGHRVARTGYVEVARLRGDGPARVVTHEMVPVLWPVLVADAGVRVVAALQLQVGVHVLGFGPQPPAADWALMLRENLPGVMLSPTAVLAPALALALLAGTLVLGFDAAAEIVSPPVAPRARTHRQWPETLPGDGTRFEDVTIFRDGQPVLHVPELDLAPGRVVGVCGPSGLGKSTLLALLSRTGPSGLAASGRARILGAPATPATARWRRTRLGLLAQDPASTLDPRDRVAIVLRRAAVRDVAEALERAGLDVAPDHRCGHLSGGQSARLATLRALAGRPALVLADEPTAGLDAISATRVATLLTQAADDGSSVVVVSHDRGWLDDVADEVHGLEVGGDGVAVLLPGPGSPDVVTPPTHGDPGDVVLAVHGLDVGVGGRPLLHDVHLEVRAGEWVALVGESGLGKTTLLRTFAGLVPGDVATTGRTQWVAQDSSEALNPARTLRATVADSMVGSRPRPRWASPREREGDVRPASECERDEAVASTSWIVDGALERLGLAKVAERRPGECSGGQRQRAALARALVAEPDVFLVDEPTSALDAASTDLVLDLLREECARGRAVVMVTHDERSVARADRVVEVGDWRA